jgi:hypothetical protein
MSRELASSSESAQLQLLTAKAGTELARLLSLR